MNLLQVNLFNQVNVNPLLKVFEVLFLVLFLIYSLLTLREVAIMNQTLVTPVARGIKIGAILQLLLAIAGLLLVLLT